jgi:tetratricopeptide (TPR) repeat protein
LQWIGPLNTDVATVLAAASSAIDGGQLAQAEALCRGLLESQPANGTAKLLLARVRRLAGDFDDAAVLAEAAARQMPKDPAPRLEAALAHAAAGRFAQAEAVARKALRLRPGFAPVLQTLAEVLMRAGKLAEALAIARRAAAIEPGNPLFRLNIASILRHSGNQRDAVAECDAALAIAGEGFPPALRLKGELLTELREPEQAVEALARAARGAPEDYDTRFALGNALFDAQHFEEAVVAFEAAGRLRPELTEADYNRARALMNLERLDEAEQVLSSCIERSPRDAELYRALARVCGTQNRIGRVFEICDLGIARCEHPWGLWQTKSDWSLILDRPDECLAYLARARKSLPPSDALPDTQLQLDKELRLAQAFALLTLGRVAEGWLEMRVRFDREFLARLHSNFAVDPSALPQDLSGKRILIMTEQGLGDELFFLRYAPFLKARGALLWYQGEPKMSAILAGRRDLFDRLPAQNETLTGVDIALFSGDLPEAAGGEIVPPLMLAPQPEMLQVWQAGLAALGPPPYLGVTWKAGLGSNESFLLRRPSLLKEIPVEDLAGAIRDLPGTVLVLQRNPAAGSIERFSEALGRPAHDLSALNERLDEMLALLSLLDEYVCVSNANAHFAASLGLSCRVLAMRWPEWRWMAAGESSPWFPGFRLYRQAPDGGWTGSLAALRSDLLSAQDSKAGHAGVANSQHTAR